MMLLWLFLLAATSWAHQVFESTEDVSPPPFNLTTTLYPVTNQTEHKIKTEATAWKIETAFSAENTTSKFKAGVSEEVVKVGNVDNGFKPSSQLGEFHELEGLKAPPTQTQTEVKKEAPTFYSSPVDPKPYRPSVLFKPELPYKSESPRPSDSWQPSTLEAQPTVDTPAKVPAGGLYKLPAFKDKPAVKDDDFGLEFFHKDKETLVRKRASGWRRLAQLATALIPVGLIVSALTPGIITVRDANTGVYTPNVNQLYTRRADVASLPNISERCRRRLLCELHSDPTYSQRLSAGRVARPCYKVPCEDPASVSRALSWLLAYHPPHNRDKPFT